MFDFDLLVIGGGPGGYVAAIHAAQLGAKTALVEKAELGGTCLNRGCIPTKSLLASTEKVEELRDISRFGIKVHGFDADFGYMMERKNQVVMRLRSGVKSLLNKNKVTIYQGTGQFVDEHTVEVDQGQRISAEKIIIATGSQVRKIQLPGDCSRIVYSDDILEAKDVPDNLVIIGGGVIGLEFGTVFHNLGTKVTIVEMMNRVLPQADGEISDLISRQLRNKGVQIFTSSRVERIREGKEQSIVILTTGEGKTVEIPADKILVATGRIAYTEGLNLEAAGVAYTDKGIPVSDSFSTNVKHIFAIGDVIGGMQLAHLASAQGIYAVENALGKESHMCLKYVPSCVYTEPEIAFAGLTEEQAQTGGKKYQVIKLPLSTSGKALAMGSESGLLKVLYDPTYGEILGVHMISPRATDIISEIVLAMRAELTVEEIATTIHPHPTIAELLWDASRDASEHSDRQPI